MQHNFLERKGVTQYSSNSGRSTGPLRGIPVGSDERRQRLLRVCQLIALAVSLAGFVAALYNVDGLGPRVAGGGFAAALILEWARLGR